MHLCVSSSIWALLTICFGFEAKRELHKKKITIKNMINTSSTCVSMHALHEILHSRAFYLSTPMFLHFQTSSLNDQISCCIQLYKGFPNSQFFDMRSWTEIQLPRSSIFFFSDKFVEWLNLKLSRSPHEIKSLIFYPIKHPCCFAQIHLRIMKVISQAEKRLTKASIFVFSTYYK